MKNHKRSWRISQILALIVLAGAVLVMAAPFRGGPESLRMKSASVVPLLATASLAHGASFQARSLSERVACSSETQFRSAVTARHLQRREIIVRKAAMPVPVDFHSPRVAWQHLSVEERKNLDRLAERVAARAIELRSTETQSGSPAEMERRSQVLGGHGEWGSLGPVVVIGNGMGMTDGGVKVANSQKENALASDWTGALPVYLVGDFNQAGATRAQWEALDEVMDYLTLKWGQVRVSVRPGCGGLETGRAGLGWMFPTERFLKALTPAKDTPAG